MGAKQSKRSVDISGKEAESAGEVAAAGAGGEGRVEQLADVDALKPQINGDAHIHEQTAKEKELDSGTPENEKDATTEKEAIEISNEKEAGPVTNGESEQKAENGESVTTTPDDGKKPKKEKVKKKWSLRSISFSRKDKPKQEKKQKEEETKTNGEPEKVPEEVIEATAEQSQNETVEEVKTPSEANEDKTPETPVTEPITNGHSTPETPQVETLAADQPVEHVVNPDADKTESKAEPEPEQLPVNGLSLEQSKTETPEVNVKTVEIVESKIEESVAEKEVVSVPEIPVIKEVCVEKVPLIEPSPPPLPANPPPSSVASFAATTMAPEMTDASLPNTAETTFTTQEPAVTNVAVHNDTHAVNPTAVLSQSQTNNTIPLPLKEEIIETTDHKPEKLTEEVAQISVELADTEEKISEVLKDNSNVETKAEITLFEETTIKEIKNEDIVLKGLIQDDIAHDTIGEIQLQNKLENASETTKNEEIKPEDGDKNNQEPIQSELVAIIENTDQNGGNINKLTCEQNIEQLKTENQTESPTINIDNNDCNNVNESVISEVVPDNQELCSIDEIKTPSFEELLEPTEVTKMDITNMEKKDDLNDDVEEFPEPPSLSGDEVNLTEIDDITLHSESNLTTKEDISENEHIPDDVKQNNSNENMNKTDDGKISEQCDTKQTNGTEEIDNIKEREESAGNKIIDECTDMVENIMEIGACNGNAQLAAKQQASEEQASPPLGLHTPQEPLPISDKMDLIPDVPFPELKPETETSSDVAVAN
ncbi:A-kinase anchor protein 200 isoform X1 [Bombyx mori]|uniref:A-kinase anchor protein 200 isoform X1 n=1 Tax=Bombyx mori TaxID=7091 RepID=UPI002ED13D13